MKNYLKRLWTSNDMFAILVLVTVIYSIVWLVLGQVGIGLVLLFVAFGLFGLLNLIAFTKPKPKEKNDNLLHE